MCGSWRIARECFGGYSGVGTPGYIPNPVAKCFCADGTARGTLWESRSLPNFILMVGCMIRFGGLCFPKTTPRVLEKKLSFLKASSF